MVAKSVTSRPVNGALNMVCPINWLHPLNNNLRSRWLVAPGLNGGSRLVDLCKNTNGSLQADTIWSPLSRPGGTNSLFFDGSSDYVNFGLPSGIASVNKLTLACWMYKNDDSKRLSFGTDGSSSGADRKVSILWNGASMQFIVANASYTSPYVTVGAGLHHVIMAYNGALTGLSRIAAFVDGVKRTLTAQNSDPASSTSSAPGNLTLAKFDANSGGIYGANYWGYGNIDDACWFNRTLSDPEARLLYLQSCLGHPDTLNWLSNRTYFLPAAAPAAGGPWPFHMDDLSGGLQTLGMGV